MNSLLFDFTVDKTIKTVFINREFAAELPLVWDAFTKAELLDQWVAPKPWTSKTKYMNFEVGGRRFYAMVSPEGLERWSIQEFRSITPKPISKCAMLLQTRTKTQKQQDRIGNIILAHKTASPK